MTTSEQELYKKWPGPVMRVLITALVFLTLPILCVLLVLTLSGSASSKQARDLARANVALQARQDCARAIANDQTTIKDAAFIQKARLDQKYIDAQLIASTDPSQVPALRVELELLTKGLDQAITAMESLKPTQELVEARCPSVK